MIRERWFTGHASRSALCEHGDGKQDLGEKAVPGSTAGTPRWAWSNEHPVNLRMSVPLPHGRYYVALVAGRERRSAARRAADARNRPLATWGNLGAIFVLGLISGLAALALIQLVSAYLFQELGMMQVAS